MTPEEQQKKTELEKQIDEEFSQLQQDLWNLKKEVETETDETKREEKDKKIKEMEAELSEINVWKERVERMTSLQEQELLSLKTRLESLRNAIQSFRWEVADLQREKTPTPTTCELLKWSETSQRLLTIISSNPKEFKKIPWDSAEAKLEYIFSKIRNWVVLFLKNKLWTSEKTEQVINNTIAPALEWSLMEMLRDQWNEANISMLKWIDKISRDSFNKLVSWVSKFATKAKWSYDKFSQWVNAIDYLSIHNGVLHNPEKSQVLTSPIEFQNYLNNSTFASESFSPYSLIDTNIFKVDENQTFEFGMSLQEKQDVLDQIWHIQVVNNPKTTALIAKMLDKPEKFFSAAPWLQNTANHLLDWLNAINPITKMFWVDIVWEVTKPPEKRSFLYKILDFICKLIWITWWLEWIVKRWRLDRLNLTDEKNKNISEIFKEYQKVEWKWNDVSITDENSCKTLLDEFLLTDLDKESSTKWDHLRDVISDNIDINLISPAVVQETLWDSYLKKESIVVNGKQQEKVSIDASKISEQDKKEMVHKHINNMKSHLSNYNDLKDFYENIHSSDDIVLCMTAALYANKDDVIEWVKAKVFLPENYGVTYSWNWKTDNGNENESQSDSSETSKYQFAAGEYPFANVPPYKWIKAYDLRNVKITPALNYSELSKKHEWTTNLNWSNITSKWREYPSNNATGNKNNNPCNISHSSDDIWYNGARTVADWQSLAKYDTPVNGIASAMRLLKRKYSNKSITEIDVWGYQWYYKPNEEIWLSALRIKWITDQCNALWVWPHKMLNFDDPTTLKSFVAQVAVVETGTHIGQQLLDEAYNKAFA